MTRRQRLIVGAASLVLLLIVGRIVSGIAADIWWAYSISETIGAMVLRRHLLAITITALAMAASMAWFVANLLLVTRSVDIIEVEEDFGALRLRHIIPPRALVPFAVGLGALAGLLAGFTFRDAIDPFLFYRSDLDYGTADVVTGTEIGRLVSTLFFREYLLVLAGVLVTSALSAVFIFYTMMGGVSREGLHTDARRHVGGLLAAAALLVACFYLLVPAQRSLAMTVVPSVAEVAVINVGATAMVGVAVGTAILSAFWAVSGRHSLLASGWLVLVIGVIVNGWVAPAMVARDQNAIPAVRPAPNDSAAYGIRQGPAVTVGGTGLPIWNEELIRRHIAVREEMPLATGLMTGVGGLSWLAVGAIGEGGRPGEVRVREIPATGDGIDVTLWQGRPRTMPQATGWTRLENDTQGVAVSGLFRRLMLAWAWQAPGILDPAVRRADHHLDPVERLTRLVPIVEWELAGVTVQGGRLYWLIQGYGSFSGFPLSTRTEWRGHRVAGVVAVMQATVDAATGLVEIFEDPADNPLVDAAARMTGAAVRPASERPVWLDDAIGYPAAWLAVQARIIAHNSATGRGEVVMTDVGRPARQLLIDDPAVGRLASIITGYRTVGGTPALHHHELLSADLPTAAQISADASRSQLLGRIRDSVRAAGDSMVAGPTRWTSDGTSLQAWFATSANGLLPVWITASEGREMRGARTVGRAFQAIGRSEDSLSTDPTKEDVRIRELREWVERAEAALERGDLTAFGRAWEAIRRLAELPD